MNGKWCCGVTLAIFLAGCMVGPDYKTPQVPLPAEYSEAAAQPTTQPTTQPADLAQWWRNFNDPVLNGLIEQAIAANRDLRAAQASVREARALRRAIGDGLFPQADLEASYQRLRDPLTRSGALSPVEIDDWQGGIDASWEIDVFGGVRRSMEAAEADLGAARENFRDVFVVLLAETALNYVDLRAFQKQVAVAQKNVIDQRKTTDLMRQRFKNGLADELDLARAEALLASTTAQIPLMEAQARRAIHRLAVLTGQTSGQIMPELVKSAPIPVGPDQVPPGVPSDLLLRRPDIRRAERELAAATARIGVATADLFPRFSLTGTFGLQSSSFSDWGNYDQRFWSIGPGVIWPIFTAGRIRAHIEAGNALQERALASYEQVILIAIGEVEDALVSRTCEQSRHVLTREAVVAGQRSVDLATRKLTAGPIDYLDVLDAQRTLYKSQSDLVDNERSIALSLVALYKALGGGWEEEPPPAPPAKQ